MKAGNAKDAKPAPTIARSNARYPPLFTANSAVGYCITAATVPASPAPMPYIFPKLSPPKTPCAYAVMRE